MKPRKKVSSESGATTTIRNPAMIMLKAPPLSLPISFVTSSCSGLSSGESTSAQTR